MFLGSFLLLLLQENKSVKTNIGVKGTAYRPGFHLHGREAHRGCSTARTCNVVSKFKDAGLQDNCAGVVDDKPVLACMN